MERKANKFSAPDPVPVAPAIVIQVTFGAIPKRETKCLKGGVLYKVSSFTGSNIKVIIVGKA